MVSANLIIILLIIVAVGAIGFFIFTADFEKIGKDVTNIFTGEQTCKKAFPDATGLVFRDPNGKCYSCPTGFNRTLTPVTAADSCSMAKDDKAFKYPTGIQAKVKKRGKLCPPGFKIDIGVNKCWKCPKGFKRSIFSVKGKTACTKGGVLGIGAKWKKAILKDGCGQGKAKIDGVKFDAAFRHGLTTNCYSCPSGYNRSAALIGSKAACVLKGGCSKMKAKSGYNTPFEHMLGGDCYSCKTGLGRTAAGIGAGNACHGVLKEKATLWGEP